ncbi:MAG: hypothetical protein ACK559_10275, partial [bacterium]
ARPTLGEQRLAAVDHRQSVAEIVAAHKVAVAATIESLELRSDERRRRDESDPSSARQRLACRGFECQRIPTVREAEHIFPCRHRVDGDRADAPAADRRALAGVVYEAARAASPRT